MKKIGLILVLLVLCLSFSSAGWFSDIFNKFTGDATSCVRCPGSSHDSNRVDYKTNYASVPVSVMLPSGGLVLNSNAKTKIDIPLVDLDYVDFTGKALGNSECKVYFIWRRGSYISATHIFTLGSSVSTINVSSMYGVGIADSMRIFTSSKCSGKVVLHNISLIGRPVYNVSLFSGDAVIYDIKERVSNISISLPKPMAIEEVSYSIGNISRYSIFSCQVGLKYTFEDNSTGFFESEYDSKYKNVKSIEVYSSRGYFSSSSTDKRCSGRARLNSLTIFGVTSDASSPSL